MKKKIMMGVLVFVIGIATIGILTNTSYAQEPGKDIGESDFAIIPNSEKEVTTVVDSIAKGGEVWDRYNSQAKSEDMSLADQIATGVMTWDTLLDYIVYLARFLGELGLLIAALVIIYIGYQKAMKVFKLGDTPMGNMIFGLIVIIAAYAIVRFFYYAFIS